MVFAGLLFLGSINVADLYLDEANGILITMTLLKEKTVPLKDLEIRGYYFWPSSTGAELYKWGYGFDPNEVDESDWLAWVNVISYLSLLHYG